MIAPGSTPADSTSTTPVRAPRPPGPRSRFPLGVVAALRFDTLEFLTRLAREYGDVVSFRGGGTDYYVLNHPDFVRDVLVTHDERFIKGPALQRAKDSLGEGLLTSEGELHRRQRRLAQPAFHPQRMAGYADEMVRQAAAVSSEWRDGQEIDLHRQMMRLTLRIVAKTLFDADVGQEVEEIGHAMDVSVGMFTRAMSPWGPLLNKLPLPSNFRFKKAWGRLNATIDRFVADRRGGRAGGDDLLSRLLNATDVQGDGGGMSDRQLRDEAITLFTAGHETTANALTFTLHLLSQNPQAEATLAGELRDVLGGNPPTAADVERLPYTRLVLSESMRLYPPAWALGREAVEPLDVAGYTIPAGATVLLSQWVTHRDPRWWPDPLTFDPTRFTPEARSARPRWAFFPFGGGSRGCIGESFAWTEAILVLATVLQTWKLESLSPAAPALRPLITLRPAHPILVSLRRR